MQQSDHQAHSKSHQKYPLCFILNDIQLLANVGGVFRLADALGVERLYLTGDTASVSHPKFKKVARSTEQHVPYSIEKNALDVMHQLQGQGYRIFSLELTTHSVPLNELMVEADDKVCLLLGAENTGVAQALLDAAELAVHIPMLGNNSSMNVVTASAIAAYCISQQLQPLV